MINCMQNHTLLSTKTVRNNLRDKFVSNLLIETLYRDISFSNRMFSSLLNNIMFSNSISCLAIEYQLLFYKSVFFVICNLKDIHIQKYITMRAVL